MLFYTHVAFSVLVSIAIFEIFPDVNPVVLIVVVVSGLFADIDISTSFIGKRFGIIGFFSEHRGAFHSSGAALVLSVPVALALGADAGLAFFIGYQGHLILDMANPQGVMLLYPFSARRIRGSIRAGGILEHCIFMALVAASGLAFWSILS